MEAKPKVSTISILQGMRDCLPAGKERTRIAEIVGTVSRHSFFDHRSISQRPITAPQHFNDSIISSLFSSSNSSSSSSSPSSSSSVSATSTSIPLSSRMVHVGCSIAKSSRWKVWNGVRQFGGDHRHLPCIKIHSFQVWILSIMLR